MLQWGWGIQYGGQIAYRKLDITDQQAVQTVFGQIYDECPIPIASKVRSWVVERRDHLLNPGRGEECCNGDGAFIVNLAKDGLDRCQRDW
jgi:hypothetical protein